MSFNTKINSPNILSGLNTVKNISNEFVLSNFNTENEDIDELIVNFFKTFSTYISANKPPSQKIKFSSQAYEAKNDYNIAKIYEKDGKLLLKSFNYENEFDKFFTQVNRIKEQKRKTRQSLKNGSLEYEIPLYKTLHLSELNNKIYEDTIFNSEIKYDVFNSIFFPKNDRYLNKDSDLIFNLNLKMVHNNKSILLLDDNKNYMNIEEELINKKDKEDNNNINLINFPEINNIHKLNINNDTNNSFVNNNINTLLNNSTYYTNSFHNTKNFRKSIHFKNNEIMIEITKYNNFIQENISLFLLNLSNNQESLNNAKSNIKLDDDNLKNINKINDINEIIKATDNTYMLDLINYFNNIFTPQLYNKFSLYKNIKINNPSEVLSEANSVLEEDENNYIQNKDEEGLMNDIKKYFDEELIKEINKDVEITQNFTHFYIEGNKFSKDNMKKIVSFLTKENYCMFAWSYNKEETKKLGLINNIIKVANLSDKVWFYINIKNSDNNCL